VPIPVHFLFPLQTTCCMPHTINNVELVDQEPWMGLSKEDLKTLGPILAEKCKAHDKNITTEKISEWVGEWLTERAKAQEEESKTSASPIIKP
jgi:hypothetical protein